ncbi:hypothetical protein ECTW00353_2933, partial [Escherichia coli TW00353]
FFMRGWRNICPRRQPIISGNTDFSLWRFSHKLTDNILIYFLSV